MGVGTPPYTSHLVSSAQLILPRPAGIGSAQVLLPIFLACGALKCTVPDVNLAAVSFSRR